MSYASDDRLVYRNGLFRRGPTVPEIIFHRGGVIDIGCYNVEVSALEELLRQYHTWKAQQKDSYILQGINK